MRELHTSLEVVAALTPRTIATDTTTAGAVVDRQGFEAVEFVIAAGTLTDGAYAVAITECDTSGGSYTAVDDADLIGTEADIAYALTEDNEVHKIGYKGSKQFVKLSIVSTATTSGGVIGAVALLGRPYRSATVAAADPA